MTEWILVANENVDRYDEIRDSGRIDWYQSRTLKHLQAGDLAYIYETKVHAIRWKCRVTDVGTGGGSYAALERLWEYPLWQPLSLDRLRENGYRGNMQGPCTVGPVLAAYLRRIEDMQRTEEGLLTLSAQVPLRQLRAAAAAHGREHPPIRAVRVKQYARSDAVAVYAKRRAGGCCELCGERAPFTDPSGNPYLEAHHVQWLARGGADDVENTVALCPNCHRRMHIVQDAQDISRLKKRLEEDASHV